MKPILKAAAETSKDNKNKDDRNNLSASRIIYLIRNKIVHVQGILFLIIALTGAVLIWRFGLIPVKHYVVDHTKLHLKFMEINKNIKRIKTNTRLIIYYEKVKPLNYKNRLKKVLDKTKILIEKTDSEYKKTAAFIKKTPPYGDYDLKINKAFKKAYFQWEIFGKPFIKRFIKYPVYIAPMTSYRLLSKYILLPVSSSVLPSKLLVEGTSSYLEHIINVYIFVFIFGTIIIVILGIILAYYFGKFLNAIIIEENERRLRTFFDKLPVPSFISDVKTGFIIGANEKAVEYYGYSKEEFKHITIAVINPFISIEEIINFRAKALKEGHNFAVLKHKLKNGDIRDVEVYISGIIYNDKPYIQEIIQDVTEKLDALNREHELMATQEALLSNTIAGISVTDRRRLYINLNNRFAEIFGYGSKDELLGQSARLLYFDDDEYNRVGEFYENIFSEHKTTTISAIYFKRKDGTAIWCEMSGSPAIINGQAAAIWTLYDITERKLLEDKLKESEELYRTLIDNLPVSLAMHKDKYIYTNPEFTNMFGYTEQELQNMYFWEIETEEYRESEKERTENGLIDINDKYNIIVRGIKKSGEKLWMHVYVACSGLRRTPVAESFGHP